MVLVEMREWKSKYTENIEKYFGNIFFLPEKFLKNTQSIICNTHNYNHNM